MKLRCPRCEKVLNVPDKYAGKAIRCPSCNRGFQVPQMKQSVVGAGGGGGLDLEDFARQEKSTQQLSEEERAEIEAKAAADAAANTDPNIRICPACGAKTRSDDPKVDILCSHCWKPISATAGGGLDSGRSVKQVKKFQPFAKGGFYTEVGSAMVYPMAALWSILTSGGIAFLAGILPVAVVRVGATVMTFSNVGTAKEGEAADFSAAALLVSGVFMAEVIFFSGVAIHTLFDVVRSTSIGEDAPPKMTWNLGDIAKSSISWLVLVVVYGGMLALVDLIFVGDKDIVQLFMKQDWASMLTVTPYIVASAAYNLAYPMMLIGLALGSLGQALNLMKVGKSILRTHLHYLFLLVLVSLYLVIMLFGGGYLLFFEMIPRVAKMGESAGSGSLGDVAIALIFWGLVMTFFFYSTYIIGRLHGLFVRSFRERLDFGTK